MERLEEWKRKRKMLNEGSTDNKPATATAAKTTGNDTDKSTKLGFKPIVRKQGSKFSKSVMSKGLLDDDEVANKHNGSSVPATAGADADDDEDPLDAFMASLGNEQSSSSAPLPSLVMDEEDNSMQMDQEEEQNPELVMQELEKKNKKELPPVDHSKIDYEPFRKKFYVEPADLADLTEAEVDSLRLELDGIKVRGQNVQKPVTRWSQFGLPGPTMDVIGSLNYDAPTSIQAQAIPEIMSGRDVIGVAKTGSGKTMAFLLPMFRHIKDQRPLEKMEGPIGLIMTPTRELALQIFRECKPFLKILNLRAVCAYGGSPIKDQIADLKRGAEIIVCTPGRMIDLLAANSGRVTNLTRVTYLVLDEADRMFDMGFEPQVMKIVNNIRPDRQTVLFSATFPRQMEALARKILSRPVEIVVGARSMVGPEITQQVEVRPEQTKFTRTLELLGQFYNTSDDARALIFVDRQENADKLLKELLQRGYPCVSTHGGKDQTDRDSAISDFKHGVVPLLIATSVAARGLDVKQLKLVINYDAPNHMEDYVHRVGRTGRAGNTGTAVTFVTPDQERSAVHIAKALRLSKVEVPQDLQKLADSFLTKVRAGNERVGSGFGGKGLERLDEARDTARKNERRAFGMDDDDDNKKDSSKETKTDDTKEDAVSKRSSREAIAAQYGLTEGPKVESGKHASSKGRVVVGAAPENKGPDSAAFHTTLEINDFPQKARWAATSNANIRKIADNYSCSVTNKGVFYPPGKEPKPGEDKKLYVLIEGPSEALVSSAYKELVSMVIEGIETAAQEPRGGRYTVT